MLPTIVTNTVFKGILSGIGAGIVGAIETIIKVTFSKNMAIKLLIGLSKMLANSTETKVDDKLVLAVEKELRKAGEIE